MTARESESVPVSATFLQSAFTKDNIAVLGTGINQATLSKLVKKSARYTLLRSSHHLRLPISVTVFIGFGSAGAPSLELAALSAYLSLAPSVKWSQGTLPIRAAAISEGTTVQVVHLPYSDASLFGLLVQGPTGAAMKEAGIAAFQVLKTAASGLNAEDLKKAIAKAKFAAASAVDRFRLLTGGESSLDSALTSLDKVSEGGSKITSALVKAKSVFVAVGDVAIFHTSTTWVFEHGYALVGRYTGFVKRAQLGIFTFQNVSRVGNEVSKA
ncbi:hypothetical protein BT96DRAFT_981531 [Gymnopus androsaceus JB14]|uniref:Peptidase M16 N-terminal domain-containing protein n=1 Tax=Gymnopus androsaceus JB14 TaxID=1447944 RepID=A0A6A4GPE4_9AGAR|nr:hypothetical protein BT96DRAFT_981531 [Gymnopus androsaceus JB14]